MGTQRKFNDSLLLSFPDGFRVMDEDELKKLNILGEGPGE